MKLTPRSSIRAVSLCLLALFTYIVILPSTTKLINILLKAWNGRRRSTDGATRKISLSSRCSFIGSGVDETAEEDAARCRADMWRQFRQDPGYESLFFRVSLDEEYKFSQSGTILQPLHNYKNPCWFATLSPTNFKKKSANPQMKLFYRQIDARLNTGENWRLRCFPFAFFIGAERGGTTDIMDSLGRHPHIFTPAIKDNFYWNYGRLLRRRLGERSYPKTFNSYISHFDLPAEKIRKFVLADAYNATIHPESAMGDTRYHPGITVDGTSNYLHVYDGWHLIPANTGLLEPRITLADTIHRIHPKARIIMLLRNPVDRFLSHYSHVMKDASPRNFHRLVVQHVEAWKACSSSHSVRACAYNSTLLPPDEPTLGGTLLRGGIYYIYLRDWLAVFPANQVCVLQSEYYFQNNTDVLNEIFKFVAVDPPPATVWDKIQHKRIIRKSSSRLRRMLPETKYVLENFYRPLNIALGKILTHAMLGCQYKSVY